MEGASETRNGRKKIRYKLKDQRTVNWNRTCVDLVDLCVLTSVCRGQACSTLCIQRFEYTRLKKTPKNA